MRNQRPHNAFLPSPPRLVAVKPTAESCQPTASSHTPPPPPPPARDSSLQSPQSRCPPPLHPQTLQLLQIDLPSKFQTPPQSAAWSRVANASPTSGHRPPTVAALQLLPCATRHKQIPGMPPQSFSTVHQDSSAPPKISAPNPAPASLPNILPLLPPASRSAEPHPLLRAARPCKTSRSPSAAPDSNTKTPPA